MSATASRLGSGWWLRWCSRPHREYDSTSAAAADCRSGAAARTAMSGTKRERRRVGNDTRTRPPQQRACLLAVRWPSRQEPLKELAAKLAEHIEFALALLEQALETYPGEVDLRQSANLQDLKMFGGRIKQDDPAALALSTPNAGTINVGTLLNWTGGTLNSNVILGTIVLAPGASGVAKPSFSNPDVNGKVKLGSILILQGTDPVNDTGLAPRCGDFQVEEFARLLNVIRKEKELP